MGVALQKCTNHCKIFSASTELIFTSFGGNIASLRMQKLEKWLYPIVIKPVSHNCTKQSSFSRRSKRYHIPQRECERSHKRRDRVTIEFGGRVMFR